MLAARVAAQAARQAARSSPIAPRAFARSYATPASSASTRPPIALYGIDGTYASALYTAAAKSSALDPTAKAIDALSKVFQKDAKLATILGAPSLSPADQKAIVTELEKHAGGSPNDVVKNFLDTLAQNNRLGALEGVCEKFGQLMGAHRGEVELVVTSATPLDQKVLRQLEGAVSKSQYVQQGQKLKVVTKVVPDIRGGLIVEIGDRTIDLSVAAKMSKMNKLLTDQL